MKATKITDGEISDMKVSALPTRPTIPSAFGGRGYTATELKAAFDRLPLYIIEKYNELIDDISGTGILDAVKSGINDTHTLGDFFADVKSGNLLTYAAAPNGTLAEYLLELRADINKIADSLGIAL